MGTDPASVHLRQAGEHREAERKPSRLIGLVTQASEAKRQCQALGPADQEESPNFPSELSSLTLSVTLH